MLLIANASVLCRCSQLTDTQLKELNACRNTAFHDISGFRRCDSVGTFTYGLRCHAFKHIYAVRCFKFWKNISAPIVCWELFRYCFAVKILISSVRYMVSVIYVTFLALLYCDVDVSVVVFVHLSVCFVCLDLCCILSLWQINVYITRAVTDRMHRPRRIWYGSRVRIRTLDTLIRIQRQMTYKI